MFCLNDISLRLTGFPFWLAAKSAIAITAYLPFVVNFIISNNINVYLGIPTKIVNFNKKKYDAGKTCYKSIFFLKLIIITNHETEKC